MSRNHTPGLPRLRTRSRHGWRARYWRFLDGWRDHERAITASRERSAARDADTANRLCRLMDDARWTMPG